jgi:Domain of unknown function (DUF4410)
MSLRSNISFGVLSALMLASSQGLHPLPAQAKEKPARPLTGYTVIHVEKFVVGTLSSKEGFPQDFEKVMQKLAVEKLTASKLFENVIDDSEASAAPSSGVPAPAEEPEHRILLSALVIGYDPGSRAARGWIGIGAGAAKVKVRFIFRDAQSNKEVLRSDLEGKFSGTWTLTGGTTEKATRQSAEKVVDELVKEIHKNR